MKNKSSFSTFIRTKILILILSFAFCLSEQTRKFFCWRTIWKQMSQTCVCERTENGHWKIPWVLHFLKFLNEHQQPTQLTLQLRFFWFIYSLRKYPNGFFEPQKSAFYKLTLLPAPRLKIYKLNPNLFALKHSHLIILAREIKMRCSSIFTTVRRWFHFFFTKFVITLGALFLPFFCVCYKQLFYTFRLNLLFLEIPSQHCEM